MGKGYALVHWIQSKRTEILKCQMIPQKYRRENAVVNLKCRHMLSGVSEVRLAKIVKIEDTKADLHNITVDADTGTIIEMSAQKSSKTATKPDVVAKKMKRKHSKKSRKSVPSKQSVHIDNNSDSDQSSSSESSAEESPDVLEDDSDEDDSRAVKSLLSSVTADSIKFIRKLLPLMENAYKMQQKKRKKDTIVEVPDPIAIINEEPENLQSCLEGFLPPMTIAAIFHRCGDRNDWKKITTDILVEIYGKQLAHLSAKGSRGAQGIDPAVYRTIYDLINMRMGWILPSKEFVRHVNKVCSNRKKAQRLKIMQTNSADTWCAIQVKQELPTPPAHVPTYEQYMSKSMDEDDKPGMPSALSTADSGSPVASSSSVGGVSSSTQVNSYQECVSKSMDNDSKPIITSVSSMDVSGSSVTSSPRLGGVAPSTQVNPYQVYISQPSSSQMEANQVPGHYLGEYIS